MERGGTDAGTSWRRIGGIAGIVFALGVVVSVGAMVGGAPTVEDPIGDIRAYFTDDTTTFFILSWFATLFFVFAFLLFASALRSVLARSDGDAGVWARASFAGAVLTVAVSGVGSTFWSVLALKGPEGYSDETIRALMTLDAVTFGAIMPWGFALFLTGASVVILRSGVLWRWLGWLGLAATLAMVIGVFWVLDGAVDGPLGTIAWVGVAAAALWSLLAGIAMIRTKEAA